MTTEGKIAKKALEEAEGKSLEVQNQILKEALTKIGEIRNPRRSSKSSWNTTSGTREFASGCVSNGWI